MRPRGREVELQALEVAAELPEVVLLPLRRQETGLVRARSAAGDRRHAIYAME